MKLNRVFSWTFVLVAITVLPQTSAQLSLLDDLLDDAPDIEDLFDAGKDIGNDLLDDLADNVKDTLGDLGDRVLGEPPDAGDEAADDAMGGPAGGSSPANVPQSGQSLLDDLLNTLDLALPFDLDNILGAVSGTDSDSLDVRAQMLLGTLNNLLNSSQFGQDNLGANDLLAILSNTDTTDLREIVKLIEEQSGISIPGLLTVDPADNEVIANVLNRTLINLGIAVTEQQLSALLLVSRDTLTAVRDYVNNSPVPVSSEDVVRELVAVLRENVVSTGAAEDVRCLLTRLSLEETLREEVGTEPARRAILNAALILSGCPADDSVLTGIVNSLTPDGIVSGGNSTAGSGGVFDDRGSEFIRNLIRSRLQNSALRTQVQTLINVTRSVSAKIKEFLDAVRLQIRNTFDGSRLARFRMALEQWVDRLEAVLRRFIFRDDVSVEMSTPAPTFSYSTRTTRTMFTTVSTTYATFAPTTVTPANGFGDSFPSFNASNIPSIFDDVVLTGFVGEAIGRIRNFTVRINTTVAMIGQYIENRTAVFRNNSLAVVMEIQKYPLPNVIITQTVNLLNDWDTLESLLRSIPNITESEIRNVQALVGLVNSSPFFRQLSAQLNITSTSGSSRDAGDSIFNNLPNVFANNKDLNAQNANDQFEPPEIKITQKSKPSSNSETPSDGGNKNQDKSGPDEDESSPDDANGEPEVQALIAAPPQSITPVLDVSDPTSALMTLGQVLLQNAMQTLLNSITADPIALVTGIINAAAQNDSLISQIIPAETVQAFASTMT